MRIISLAILAGVLLMWTGLAWAVDIQYVLASGDVTSASDISIPNVPGHGIVTLTGTVSQIIWPVPNGCSTGKLEWSRISDSDTVTLTGGGMVVKTGLVFFSTTSPMLTGCHIVNSWMALKSVVNRALLAGIPDNEAIPALDLHWTWYEARCHDAPTNQNCVDWLNNLTVMITMYPGRGQGVTRLCRRCLTCDGCEYL